MRFGLKNADLKSALEVHPTVVKRVFVAPLPWRNVAMVVDQARMNVV